MLIFLATTVDPLHGIWAPQTKKPSHRCGVSSSHQATYLTPAGFNSLNFLRNAPYPLTQECPEIIQETRNMISAVPSNAIILCVTPGALLVEVLPGILNCYVLEFSNS
jgi:hypothetical protein